MKAKLLQLLDLLKKAALWAFKITLRALKVLTQQTIIVLTALDTLLTRNI